jgi:hypothetical protein
MKSRREILFLSFSFIISLPLYDVENPGFRDGLTENGLVIPHFLKDDVLGGFHGFTDQAVLVREIAEIGGPSDASGYTYGKQAVGDA